MLYDLANTLFSMNIVSLYLALRVIDMGGTDATWGYVISVTMVLVFVSAPVLSALSDQRPPGHSSLAQEPVERPARMS